MRIAGLLLVGALCAGCFGGSAPTQARDAHLGVTAAFPPTWSVIWRPCPGCVDPRGIFVAASYQTAAGSRALMCRPVPDGGVVISLDEVLPGLAGYQAPPRGDYPPRPRSFHARGLGPAAPVEGCNAARARIFRFRDSGRLLYAWMVFGRHPSRAVRHGAEAVLNSLRIAPLP
jgi:hypothetical protein